MNISIEITEGCTCYSYLINNKEWHNLIDKDNNDYDLELLEKVTDALINDIQKQYNLPNFIIDIIYDNNEYPLPISQSIFVTLVKNNINTKYENLGNCECCGDTIESWKLKLKCN